MEILKNLKDKKGIHLFRLPTVLLDFKSNIYFIEGPIPTLIDAPQDIPGNVEELDRGLKDTGYSLNDIKAIFITHPHLDHFGSARIAKRSGAQVWAIEATFSRISRFEQEGLEEKNLIRTPLYTEVCPRNMHLLLVGISTE
jgi:glyoxylase-like metal-dependent hydrolase (beta-lactamase superfamily II)